jgi:hypothetical protein
MILETRISFGHESLLWTFFDANNLKVQIVRRKAHPVDKIDLYYDEESDTAQELMFMGLVHSGIENMLDDYLIKCGVRPDLINTFVARREMTDDMLEKKWQEHKKKLGI